MVGPRHLDAGGPSADPAHAPASAWVQAGAPRAGRHRPQPAPRPESPPGPRATPWPGAGGDGDAATAVLPGNGHRPGPTGHGAIALDPALVPVPDPAVVAEPVPEEAPEEAPEAGHPPAPVGPDVWALVRRAQEGDVEAFGELYDHYVGMVHRYVHHRVGDRATAEDVTSETFVRALRRIDSLSFQGRDVGAWLITIARNIVRDHVKSSRYRLEIATADMRDADTVTDGPEDDVVQRLTNATLVECLRALRPDQQECLALRFLHGLSVAETAAVMGKREGAVKALQHRAVRRLAASLPEGLR